MRITAMMMMLPVLLLLWGHVNDARVLDRQQQTSGDVWQKVTVSASLLAAGSPVTENVTALDEVTLLLQGAGAGTDASMRLRLVRMRGAQTEARVEWLGEDEIVTRRIGDCLFYVLGPQGQRSQPERSEVTDAEVTDADEIDVEEIDVEERSDEDGEWAGVLDLCAGTVRGTFQSPAAEYSVRPAGDDTHVLKKTLKKRRVTVQLDEDFSGDDIVQFAAEYSEAAGAEARNVSAPPSPRHRDRRSVHAAPRHLEVLLVTDQSVVQYHGEDLVEQYLLTQMSIVDKVYHHESLGVEINVVVSKMMFITDALAQSMVAPANNVKRTLDNFCYWAHGQRPRDASSADNFDIAILITRNDFGPAGYASVNGMCEAKRSCSVNRDDGISSAFVIAHEIGHVLGMGHDGSNNDCDGDPHDGKLMAHTVLSNYNQHYWTNCSEAALRQQLPRFHCLNNVPAAQSSWPTFSQPYGQSWSLDDQCRQEFGDDYAFCSNFNLDPCEYLWCSTPYNVTLCKSKRGPPLSGTICGDNKWCMDGRCQYRSDVAVAGGWSEWNEWQQCSRTCGVGVQFRYRSCNQPRPAHGGADCVGTAEEQRLCNTSPCSVHTDTRAEQCAALNDKYFVGNRRHHWMPQHSSNDSKVCKLTCVSAETSDTFVTEEDVIDGTFCSYDSAVDVCIKGQCKNVGCDGDASKKVDACGVCNGDNSACTKLRSKFTRLLPQKAYHTVFVLPAESRAIRIQEDKSSAYLAHFLAIKDLSTGELLLNGDGKQGPATEMIIHGAKFTYKSKGFEALEAQGPLLAPIEIMVYSLSSKLAAAIHYDYLVPWGVAAKVEAAANITYVWHFAGWTDCTEACGQGVQREQYQCVMEHSRQPVDAGFCSELVRPRANTRPCNTRPCLHNHFMWKKESWGECLVSACGGQEGKQQRDVYCITSTLVSGGGGGEESTWKSQSVDPRYCLHQETIPATQRSCTGPPCMLDWSVGQWSQCSTSCGSGVETRRVFCHHPEGPQHRYRCRGRQPADTRRCHNNPCPVQEIPASRKPKKYGIFEQLLNQFNQEVSSQEVSAGAPTEPTSGEDMEEDIMDTLPTDKQQKILNKTKELANNILKHKHRHHHGEADHYSKKPIRVEDLLRTLTHRESTEAVQDLDVVTPLATTLTTTQSSPQAVHATSTHVKTTTEPSTTTELYTTTATTTKPSTTTEPTTTTTKPSTTTEPTTTTEPSTTATPTQAATSTITPVKTSLALPVKYNKGCRKDKSFFCRMGVSKASCKLPLYLNYCCHSCRLFI